MRLARTIVFAALAALVVTCSVDVAFAPADTLCKADEDPCQEAKTYAKAVKGFDKKSNFLGGSIGACESEYLATYVKNEGAHTGLLLLITKFTLFSCPGECQLVKVAHLPLLMRAVALKGHVLIAADGNGPIAVVLEKCTVLGLKCEYEPPEAEVLLDYVLAKEGGSHLAILDAPLIRKFGTSFCPEKVKWDALYSLTEDNETSAGLSLVALP